jgi:hypothetical protein
VGSPIGSAKRLMHCTNAPTCSVRQHTSEYVSIRAAYAQHTSEHTCSIRQSIRAAYVQLTSAATPLPALALALAYVSIRQHTRVAYVRIRAAHVSSNAPTSAGPSSSIRQHTSAYVSIRMLQCADVF